MPHNKKKSNKTTYNKINFIENLDELEVNTVKDISNYKDFKSLNIEDRLIILKVYLNKIDISDIDKTYFINLVKNDNLKNKTDIDYDKINGCIRSIKLLIYNCELSIYVIQKTNNENLYEKQIIKSKRNINKLIH
jgi:hypothetical protein